MSEIRLARQPLAWGMQMWGPLPASCSTLFWGGPGDGLYLVTADRHQRIRHPSAAGTYDTIKAASNAALAFARAGLEGEG
jgi:hypothetical protein